jgi:hypothetical protein
MAINAKFISCLGQFTALRATWKALGEYAIKEDTELAVIMEDAVASPFRDLLSAGAELGTATADALKDLANFDNLKNPLDGLIRLFLLPLENVINIIGAGTPRELKEKLKDFLKREGFAISLTDPTRYVGIAFSSAIQGVATINHQRKLLQQLDAQVKSVIDGMRDTPNITPPVHPFNETLIHLATAKQNFTSVRNQLVRLASVDETRYSTGINELREAQSSIYNGRIGESLGNTLINQAGLGGPIGFEHEDGRTKFVNKQELTAIDFLPPVELGFNIGIIRRIVNQISAYNSALFNIQSLLSFMVNNLYFATDIGRLLGAMIQFLILQVTDIEETLDGAATNSPIGRAPLGVDRASKSPTGTLVAQGESYANLALTIGLANAIKLALDKRNKNDVNDIPGLKTFRNKLSKMNPDQCNTFFVILQQNTNSFIAAYNRRMAQRVSGNVVKASGQRLRFVIKQQLDYLDCFEEVLNELGLDNIPNWVLEGMAWVGSAMAFLQDYNISDLKELFSNFDPRAVIAKQMEEKLACMKNACNNPGVQGIVDRLHSEFASLNKSFKTSANLNTEFSSQAKFNRQFNGNRISDTIEQFINAVNQLAC